MPRPNLRRTAAEQARAEYQPQIRGVRREARGQVRSVRSMAPALTASLEQSGKALRHAGLSPYDLAIAEKELAHRIADAGASTALQTSQITQDAHAQISDLLASQGQAQRSALSAMQAEQAQQQEELAAERRGSVEDFKMGILREQTLKGLGLGSYAEGGDGDGFTPTQERAQEESHHTAAYWAKKYVAAAKEGLADEETGEEILPAGPAKWTDEQWDLFVAKTASKEGVNSIEDAQRAVQAIRDHFQQGQGDPLDALKRVASVAIPALAPKSLQPVAQFAGAALGR